VTDIVPTGYEVGVFNGEVRPGQVVDVVGAGPIGLSAIMDSRMDRPSHIVAVEVINSRLEAAKSFGADNVVNGSGEGAMEVVH
jgi:alcohol dehydrogenase